MPTCAQIPTQVNVHPDLSDWEAAMQELLTRIASVAERVRPSQADALEDGCSGIRVEGNRVGGMRG